jgi:hypothetical protein
MKHAITIQHCLWFGFLAYYTATKFSAGGAAYSHAYALQVAIIVALTAIVPFYASSYASSRIARAVPRLKLWALLLLPASLAMAGYAAFFFTFIAPNFPDIAAIQVISRGLLPGIVISALLLFPSFADRLVHKKEATAS